ncbi:MAG: GDP-mannose 4,6-dehydratase, partial [Patescibacteria group bacterium]
VKLNYFIKCIEKELGKKAKKKLMSMQPGDVKRTYADISKAKKLLNWEPNIKIEEGLKEFIKWYKIYHR